MEKNTDFELGKRGMIIDVSERIMSQQSIGKISNGMLLSMFASWGLAALMVIMGYSLSFGGAFGVVSIPIIMALIYLYDVIGNKPTLLYYALMVCSSTRSKGFASSNCVLTSYDKLENAVYNSRKPTLLKLLFSTIKSLIYVGIGFAAFLYLSPDLGETSLVEFSAFGYFTDPIEYYSMFGALIGLVITILAPSVTAGLMFAEAVYEPLHIIRDEF